MFKINTTAFFQTIITDATLAAQVAGKATGYVVIAEQLGKALGLTGPQKLNAVQTMLLADLKATAPVVADAITKDWPKIAGVINAMVAFFNFLGWAFQATAPIIAAADPGAVLALTAVNAAINAVEQLKEAAANPPSSPAPAADAGAPQGQEAA